MKPVRPKSYEVYGVEPTTKGANVAKFRVECGACGYTFRARASMAELSQGYPHRNCTNCGEENYIPYTISGRG